MLKHPRNASKKFQKNVSSRTGDIPIWPNYSKEVSKLKDWQTKKKFVTIWEKCKDIPGMFLSNFRNISNPGLDISLHFSNFSKEVNQQTYWQTYKQFVIIGKWCNNIQGVSLKICRKISHPGQDISLYWPDFSK